MEGWRAKSVENSRPSSVTYPMQLLSLLMSMETYYVSDTVQGLLEIWNSNAPIPSVCGVVTTPKEGNNCQHHLSQTHGKGEWTPRENADFEIMPLK